MGQYWSLAASSLGRAWPSCDYCLASQREDSQREPQAPFLMGDVRSVCPWMSMVERENISGEGTMWLKTQGHEAEIFGCK